MFQKYLVLILVICAVFILSSCNEANNPITSSDYNEQAINAKAPGTFSNSAAVIETLTPFLPILPSGSSTGMMIEGAGLVSQPSNIVFNLPNGITIEKVFIYWVGKGNEPGGGDNTIKINNSSVLGELIGTSLPVKGDIVRYSYRADITNMNLDFSNAIELDEVNFGGIDGRADGAAIVVIYSNPGDLEQEIVIHDGADFVWLCAPNDSDPQTFIGNEQTFTFTSSTKDRNAVLHFLVGDAESIDRPDRIVININGSTAYSLDNVLNGSSGEQFDVIKQNIFIPAGVNELKVNVESGPGDCSAQFTPESLIWIFGGLAIEDAPQSLGCTYTQGYWKNHPSEWPVESLKLGKNSYNKEELISILKQPVKGNGLISLAHQLITTKLNLANGAEHTGINDEVNAADLLIGSRIVPPVGEGYLKPKVTSSLNDRLDSYNTGATGPGHCN